MDSVSKITKILRIVGGASLVCSTVHFIMAGRYDMNSLSAHYLFLGLNALLCVLGILAAKKFSEMKTARTFIGLSLAMIPAQMAQLGAYIYSRFNGIPENIPELAQFSVPTNANIQIISGISLVVLFPIIYLGFSTLFRSASVQYSLNYMMSSLAILLPYRNPETASVTVGALVLFNLTTLRQTSGLKTLEAKIAKAVLFIPSLIIVGRTFLFL
jgi:hypothetical protein